MVEHALSAKTFLRGLLRALYILLEQLFSSLSCWSRRWLTGRWDRDRRDIPCRATGLAALKPVLVLYPTWSPLSRVPAGSSPPATLLPLIAPALSVFHGGISSVPAIAAPALLLPTLFTGICLHCACYHAYIYYKHVFLGVTVWLLFLSSDGLWLNGRSLLRAVLSTPRCNA